MVRAERKAVYSEEDSSSLEKRANFLRQKEADFLLKTLLAKEPDFLDSYRYLFPPGMINTTLAYYEIHPLFPASSDVVINPDIDLVRRLIYITAPYPLPGSCFLVGSKAAREFETLWEHSVPTFFLGRVGQRFLPQRRGYSRVTSSEFSEQQQTFFALYQKENIHPQHLFTLNPKFIYPLEAYYFQRKLLPEIALEMGMKTSQAHFYKELASHALGVKKTKAPYVAKRYQFWLEPVLRRWEENEQYITTLPPVLRSVAWLSIRGVGPQEVAQKFDLPCEQVKTLQNHLFGRIPEYEPFKDTVMLYTAEQLSCRPFDQQPITKITQAVLATKAAGQTTPQVDKNLGLNSYQINYLLQGCLEDLQWAFPDQFRPPQDRFFFANHETGQQLITWYQNLIAKMTHESRNLTPRQQQFLKNIQPHFTYAERRILSLYLGRILPRKNKHEARKTLAQTLLKTQLTSFLSQEQDDLQKIAQGLPMTQIFPRGVKDLRYIQISRKMERLKKAQAV